MTLYTIFFFLVCLVLLWVTIQGKDTYPFSHYPMFSTISSIENIVVYRLAFEKQDGTIEWWKSEFYRYPEFVGKKLAPVLHSSGTNHKTTIVSLLQKNKLLLDVIRLMELEGMNVQKYTAIHIIKRTMDDTLEVHNTTIDIISISTLQNGATA